MHINIYVKYLRLKTNQYLNIQIIIINKCNMYTSMNLQFIIILFLLYQGGVEINH